MSTASTKRARKKARAAARQRAQRSGASASVVSASREESSPWSESTWTYVSLGVLLIATLLRVSALELKPMHHDEGVNGFFLTTLLRQGKYFYDPGNYHGPTLYYISLPFVALLGLNTFAVRLVTAAFGVATVGLVLCLRRYLGTIGAIAAAMLVAVSPGAVYYSRYFIHETLFVFFTLGLVVAALWYSESKQGFHLMLASASAAMMFATKETAFISVGVLALAFAIARGFVRYTSGEWKGLERSTTERSLESDRPRSMDTLALAGVALLLFVFLNVLFYSSFFTNAKGIRDSLETFKVWTDTGTSDFHKKEFVTYVKWLFKEEATLVILATFGAAAALLRRNRFAIFAGAWGFGTALAYSLIPYKTPWLMLSFIVPMAIVGGYGVKLIVEGSRRSEAARSLATVMLVAALAVCVYQTLVLNFREYDNDQYPYVYAHTRRETDEMMREVERMAAKAGTSTRTGIAIATPDYWPLPWYLRDYKGVAYDQKVLPTYDPEKTPIIIAKAGSDLDKLRETLGIRYKQIGDKYPLRPGVDLVLFGRANLADP